VFLGRIDESCEPAQRDLHSLSFYYIMKRTINQCAFDHVCKKGHKNNLGSSLRRSSNLFSHKKLMSVSSAPTPAPAKAVAAPRQKIPPLDSFLKFPPPYFSF